MIDKLDLGQYEPRCNLAHGLVNKLSVIVGYCDLSKDDVPEESKCRKHIEAIRSIAKNMAEELLRHQCDREVIMTEAKNKPLPSGEPVSTSKQSA